MGFCPLSVYKNIFGKEGTGLHRFRLLDVALVDYLLSILSAILFSAITKFPLVLSTILIFILGIILHMLFGVKTSAVKFLGLNC